MKFEWERLSSKIKDDSSAGNVTKRARVFGGWVVQHIIWCSENNTQSESMVFVPDVNHEWVIDNE